MSTTAYCGPEVIQEVQLPTPEPGAGHITIDVQYAAFGLIDAMIRRGTFADLDCVPKPSYVPGLEVTGTVRALGEGVTGLSIGEPVATVTLPFRTAEDTQKSWPHRPRWSSHSKDRALIRSRSSRDLATPRPPIWH